MTEDGSPDPGHEEVTPTPSGSGEPSPDRARPGAWSTPPPGTDRPGEAPPGAPADRGQQPTRDTDAERAAEPAPPPTPGPDEPPQQALIGEVLPPGTGPAPRPAGEQYPSGQHGPPPQPPNGPAEFRSNLGTSVAMFALFPPFALPATVNARRAGVALQAGDRVAADDAAEESRRWSRFALAFGLVSWALLVCCGGGGFVLHSCGVGP